MGQLLRATDLGQYSVTAAQPGIAAEMIRGLRIPVPPLPEQAAIAGYLDVETAKLDALVGKVEEAAERLHEYRTALITSSPPPYSRNCLGLDEEDQDSQCLHLRQDGSPRLVQASPRRELRGAGLVWQKPADGDTAGAVSSQ